MNVFPEIDKKQTGQNIKSIMKKQGYTCKDIQEYLCLSCVQTVYRWLDGTNLPSLDNLYALSRLFHTSMDDFVAGNEETYSSLHIKETGFHYYYA